MQPIDSPVDYEAARLERWIADGLVTVTDPAEIVLVQPAQRPPEAWHWRAIYTDDSELCEYNADGTTNPFGDIDMSRLDRFVLDPQHDGLQHHLVKLTNDMRLIFYRRRKQETNPVSGESWHIGSVYLIGFQKTVGGRNVKSVSFYFEDGSSLITDDPESIQ